LNPCIKTLLCICFAKPCRGRLAKLLRFHTSKSPKDLTSLAGYVSRMKPGQKTIFWIAGLSQEEVARSPFAEKLVAEVRFLCCLLREHCCFVGFLEMLLGVVFVAQTHEAWPEDLPPDCCACSFSEVLLCNK
jgi:hypothetical protein